MLKYKVVTEKLDWKGEIVREVRDFEDPAFGKMKPIIFSGGVLSQTTL